VIRSLEERMKTVVLLAEETTSRYADQLRRGEVRVTPTDVVAVTKLQLLIEGHVEHRLDGAFSHVTQLTDEELTEELGSLRELQEGHE
jgi:hypothetical protein